MSSIAKKKKIKRNAATGCMVGKTLASDKRHVRRDQSGQFSDKPTSSKVSGGKSKGDKMFEKVWKDTYDRRDRRVG